MDLRGKSEVSCHLPSCLVCLPVAGAVLLPDDPPDDGAADPGERERLRHRRHDVVHHLGAVAPQRVVQHVLAVHVLDAQVEQMPLYGRLAGQKPSDCVSTDNQRDVSIIRIDQSERSLGAMDQ